MSEYCILQRNGEIRGGGRRDLGMNTALYVARIIHHDLTLTHARSWQWWTAITQVDFKDGLVYLDDGSEGSTGRMGGHVESLMHDGVVRESKLLWTLGNYSRFVRPGMVRVKCDVEPEQSPVDGLLASAYQGPAGEDGRRPCQPFSGRSPLRSGIRQEGHGLHDVRGVESSKERATGLENHHSGSGRGDGVPRHSVAVCRWVYGSNPAFLADDSAVRERCSFLLDKDDDFTEGCPVVESPATCRREPGSSRAPVLGWVG